MKLRNLLVRRRRGFSLIEVMIGLVIMLIALAAAAALSINNARLVQRNQLSVHAANLAEWKMEQLRNATFATLASGTDAAPLNSSGGTANPAGIFTRSWTIFDNTPDVGLKSVLITVQWSQFTETQTYTLRGVIGP
jgi:prepilin-type N-terminal cleavage/methylation domain-containing protein